MGRTGRDGEKGKVEDSTAEELRDGSVAAGLSICMGICVLCAMCGLVASFIGPRQGWWEGGTLSHCTGISVCSRGFCSVSVSAM